MVTGIQPTHSATRCGLDIGMCSNGNAAPLDVEGVV